MKELKSYISNNFEIPEYLIKVIDNMVLYSGKALRRGNLFKEASSMINNTRKFFGSMFGDDVKNVFL